MKRNVIEQKSAYTITLPIDWVRDHNLDGKDEVNVKRDGDDLVISTEQRSERETVELELEESTDDYYRIMIENHYLKGYDELDVTYPEEAFSTIQEVVANLIGFEIVEHGTEQCQVRSTATPSEREFSQLLNRVFNIIDHTQERTKDALDDGFHSYETVASLTKDARRFLLFCTRTLHKKHIGPRKDESFFHLLLERLILIQHDHKYTYQKLEGDEPEFDDDVVELYETVCDMFGLFREAFHAGELRQFAAINNRWHRIYFTHGHEILDDCSEDESVVVYHALHLSQLIFLIAQPNLVRQQEHVNW